MIEEDQIFKMGRFKLSIRVYRFVLVLHSLDTFILGSDGVRLGSEGRSGRWWKARKTTGIMVCYLK